MWNTACLDWRDRLMSGSHLVPDLPLFEDEAARALRIFDRLQLPDVPGQPTMAEACGDWFRPIVAALFGSFDAANNRRMIQELFLGIPKKNAKSSNAAAIMVVAMLMNRRPNAEFLLIAPTKEIADIAFKQASGIVRCDAQLGALFHAQRHIRTLTHMTSGATLQIKAADTDVITGSKSTGILIDETHVFAKKSKASEIFVEIRGALAARTDGFLIQVTTQSKEAPSGVFKKELALARKVRDGEIRLPRLAIIYELPEDIARNDGWKRQEYWPLVNPNLGLSVDLQFLQNELIAAEEGGPEALRLFASQHFNVEIGLALKDDAWAGAPYWESAADTSLTLEALLDRVEVATVGIDGGGLDDLLGLAVMGRCQITSDWLLWSRAWAHDDVMRRRKEIAETLRDFADQGDLIFCERSTQDVEEVAEIVEMIKARGLLPDKAAVGLDPAGVAAIVDELQARGIGGDQTVAVAQGYRLSGAVWGMERKLRDGTFWHSGQPLMRWCVGNAKAETRGNAVLITKQAAGRAKIDPLAAALNAFSLMSAHPNATNKSYLESNSLLVL